MPEDEAKKGGEDFLPDGLKMLLGGIAATHRRFQGALGRDRQHGR